MEQDNRLKIRRKATGKLGLKPQATIMFLNYLTINRVRWKQEVLSWRRHLSPKEKYQIFLGTVKAEKTEC